MQMSRITCTQTLGTPRVPPANLSPPSSISVRLYRRLQPFLHTACLSPPLFPRCSKSLSFLGSPLVCRYLFILGMIWFVGNPLAAPSLAEHSADFQSSSPCCHLLFQTTATKFHAVFCSPPSWFHAQMCLCLLCSAPWSCII